MNIDEERDKPLSLKVVSEDPSAPVSSGLEILRAAQQAKWELAKVAASSWADKFSRDGTK